MSADASVVHSDPGILGGTPVFVATRVPVRILFEYLEAGSYKQFAAQESGTHPSAGPHATFGRRDR